VNAATPISQAGAGGAIVNGLSVDVEDWFQVGAFEGVIERDNWASLTDRVERNVHQILDRSQSDLLRARLGGPAPRRAYARDRAARA
jgi:hypothetical protein